MIVSGVNHFFGVPGLHIDPLYIASVNSGINAVVNCHELSAGYMAEGYSLTSEKLGVLVGIGGPGSNNMITSITNAKREKTALLVITGDVSTKLSDVPAFQCANEIGTNDDAIFKLITKHSERVRNINQLVGSLDKAIRIAMTPPFGPSHLIIPQNILLEMTTEIPVEIDFKKLKYWKQDNSDKTVDMLSQLILSDKKVIFWIGSSLNKSDEASYVLELAEKFNIPVTTTYNAKGVIPETHELSLGNFGFSGSYASRELMLSDKADLIIGFDIEQNERNTSSWDPRLYKDKEILLVNFPGEFKDNRYGKTIEDNPYYILQSLYFKLKNRKYTSKSIKIRSDFWKHQNKEEVLNTTATENTRLEPGRLVEIMKQEIPPDAMLFVDSGNHRIFPGIYWRSQKPKSFFSAATLAPLGWAIAAAIGGNFAQNKPTVIFTGDGCMQMHGIELKTAVKHQRPVLVIIINNGALGSIHSRFSKISEEAASLTNITEIDWNSFCKSFGAEVHEIKTERSFRFYLRKFLSSHKLTILNVRTTLSPYYDRSLTT